MPVIHAKEQPLDGQRPHLFYAADPRVADPVLPRSITCQRSSHCLADISAQRYVDVQQKTQRRAEGCTSFEALLAHAQTNIILSQFAQMQNQQNEEDLLHFHKRRDQRRTSCTVDWV